MSKVLLLFKNIYEWNKRDFWLINSLCVLAGFLIHRFEINHFLQLAVLVLLLIKFFYFMKGASITPSLQSGSNQFSWKYLQSLPLTHRELLAFLVLTDLFAFTPGLVWLFSFQKFLFIDLFEMKDFTYMSCLKVVLGVLPVLIFLSLLSTKNLIEFPRKQFIQKNDRHGFYQGVKNLLLRFTIILYALIAGYYLEVYAGVRILSFMDKTFKVIGDLFESWFLFPTLLALMLVFSIKLLNIWQNEKLSYQKINWKPRRDFSLIVACLILVYIPFESTIFSVSHYYRTDKILQYISENNVKMVEDELNRGIDPNLQNEYGVTPLMAAAREGNLKLFRLLETHGAKRNVITNLKPKTRFAGGNVLIMAIDSKNAKLVKYLLETGESPNAKNLKHNYYALHTAARTCSPEIVDLLIAKGADLHVKNKFGQNALHTATQYSCFASVISLQEAGLDPLEKDHQGKTALDYLKWKKGDLAYFLTKKARGPAGLK